MEDRDYIARAIAGDGQIRGLAITSKTMVEKARRIHSYSPLAIAALGRTMSGALMMADNLKGEGDLLTVVIRGDGPLKQILVTADSHGHVKGYASVPDVDLPLREGHLDVGKAVGKGTLTVIRDLGLKEPYVGTVDLRTGEIADDLTYYFAKSEQTPTAMGLGVLVDTNYSIKAAGGFILQLMPGHTQETVSKLEKNLSNLPSVTEILSSEKTPEELLQLALKGFDIEFLGTRDVSFLCTCSKERFVRNLKMLGADELEDMAEKDRGAELTCDFCGMKYSYTAEELMEIVSELRSQKAV